MTLDVVAERLDVDPSAGLNAASVSERAERFGRNELAEPPRRPAWLRFLSMFNDVLVYILIAAAVISAAVGDLKDPIVIAVVLVINAVLGFVQERPVEAGEAVVVDLEAEVGQGEDDLVEFLVQRVEAHGGACHRRDRRHGTR